MQCFLEKNKKNCAMHKKMLDINAEFAYCALQQLLQCTTTGDLK
jgi:hypothetical protein